MCFAQTLWRIIMIQKKIILVVLILVQAIMMLGQNKISSKNCIPQYDSVSNRMIYYKTDPMPNFPGGEDSLYSFIEKNYKFPPTTRELPSGTAYISFIIETDGNLSNKILVKGIDRIIDNELLRILEIMPKWIPGMCNGEAVPVKFNLPVKFVYNN